MEEFSTTHSFPESTPLISEPGKRWLNLCSWHQAILTLAKFYHIDFEAIGLHNFGRAGDYYQRQLKTWKTIHDAQAQVKDVDTGIPVGPMPHVNEMVTFFAQNLPKDRISLVHGDYKIDNMVFHKTQSKVIGILDWELSTIGHPLSDLVNLLYPFRGETLYKKNGPSGGGFIGLTSKQLQGVPTLDECIDCYAAEAGWDPRVDWDFGIAFSEFRVMYSEVLIVIDCNRGPRHCSSICLTTIFLGES